MYVRLCHNTAVVHPVYQRTYQLHILVCGSLTVCLHYGPTVLFSTVLQIQGTVLYNRYSTAALIVINCHETSRHVAVAEDVRKAELVAN